MEEFKRVALGDGGGWRLPEVMIRRCGGEAERFLFCI